MCLLTAAFGASLVSVGRRKSCWKLHTAEDLLIYDTSPGCSLECFRPASQEWPASKSVIISSSHFTQLRLDLVFRNHAFGEIRKLQGTRLALLLHLLFTEYENP